MQPEPGALASRFLDVVETDILPLTRAGVAAGNKIFGAAVLAKRDLALVVAGTNGETANPLKHGEIAALDAFYRLPPERRPDPRDCLFLSTHEPCPLCLSAITWAGFDNFTYLFPYEATRDAFNMPHDLRILQEVFGVADGAYRRTNAFWTSRSLQELVDAVQEGERPPLAARMAALGTAYAALSDAYQKGKGQAAIPLA